eukprot:10719-Eustigmatos_ZCMA.PRE.1
MCVILVSQSTHHSDKPRGPACRPAEPMPSCPMVRIGGDKQRVGDVLQESMYAVSGGVHRSKGEELGASQPEVYPALPDRGTSPTVWSTSTKNPPNEVRTCLMYVVL